MRVVSLGHRTDLALLNAGGSVVDDAGDHLVVRSPHNPAHWWGNLLLLDRAPAEQDAVRWLERFVEVHVDAPLVICEQRDVKGMYAEARAGKRSNFTGIDDPYEPPLSPEVRVCTAEQTVSDCLASIVGSCERLGYLPST